MTKSVVQHLAKPYPFTAQNFDDWIPALERAVTWTTGQKMKLYSWQVTYKAEHWKN